MVIEIIFMQKFEMECSYEYRCINRGFEELEKPVNHDYIAKWKTGHTGYPLVDACMRSVIQNGWLNFRMRAMLVSFLCHHLYQDWRMGKERSYQCSNRRLRYAMSKVSRNCDKRRTKL